MNNKKVFGFAIIAILLMNFVSAYTGIDLRQGAEQVIELVVDFAEPFLQVVLGGEDYTGLLLFERFLIFILLLSVIYLSLKNIAIFNDTPAVLWLVSVIVPLIAIRFINFEWLNAILVSYQILGIAIAGILPFIIYLLFLHNVSDNSSVRKIGWIFFIVIYFGLWSTNENMNYAQIYFWTMLIALVFLLLDGSIHKWYMKEKMQEANKAQIVEKIAELRQRIIDLQARPMDRTRKARAIRALGKQIKDYEKLI